MHGYEYRPLPIRRPFFHLPGLVAQLCYFFHHPIHVYPAALINSICAPSGPGVLLFFIWFNAHYTSAVITFGSFSYSTSPMPSLRSIVLSTSRSFSVCSFHLSSL